jgi:hypothetical protein
MKSSARFADCRPFSQAALTRVTSRAERTIQSLTPGSPTSAFGRESSPRAARRAPPRAGTAERPANPFPCRRSSPWPILRRLRAVQAASRVIRPRADQPGTCPGDSGSDFGRSRIRVHRGTAGPGRWRCRGRRGCSVDGRSGRGRSERGWVVRRSRRGSRERRRKHGRRTDRGGHERLGDERRFGKSRRGFGLDDSRGGGRK